MPGTRAAVGILIVLTLPLFAASSFHSDRQSHEQPRSPHPLVQVEGKVSISPQPGAQSTVSIVVTNPGQAETELLIRIKTPSGWTVTPRHTRLRLGPGASASESFAFLAPALGPSRPELAVRTEPVARTDRSAAPPGPTPIPLAVTLPEPDPHAPARGFLRLNGSSAIRVDLDETPDRFTLEAWVRAAAPAGRQGLITNTESGGFGIFWSDGDRSLRQPSGFVRTDAGYTRVAADAPWDFARWTHIALTYDGLHARFFVNGHLTESAEAAAPRIRSTQPLYIGADTDARGRPLSFWSGELDEVRLSGVVRYESDFIPSRRHETDADTLLHFAFDEDFGPVFRDRSGHNRHGWAAGRPRVILADD